MKTFPVKVEQWRGTVRTAIGDVLEKIPARNLLINALGLTIDDLSDIVLAIIQKESSGVASATGDAGNSVGLMQLNYGAGTPQGEGFTGTKEDLFTPYINLYYGVKYFLTQLDRYRDVESAILAYNAGSVRTGESGLPINLDYLNKVVSYLSEKKILFLPESWSTFYSDSTGKGLGPVRPSIVESDADHKFSSPGGIRLDVDDRHTLSVSVGPASDKNHNEGSPAGTGRLGVLSRIVSWILGRILSWVRSRNT